MEKAAQELPRHKDWRVRHEVWRKKLAKELRAKDEELSIEVREAGRQTQEGFERVIRAIHKLHNHIVMLPDKLTRIAENLKKSS